MLSGQHASLVSDLLDVLRIEAFDAQVASIYGLLQAERQRLGIRLSAMDLLIDAHAMALGRTLVSRDQVFAHVPGLLESIFGRSPIDLHRRSIS